MYRSAQFTSILSTISLETITDETENYAQKPLSTCTQSQKHTNYTNTAKEGHTFLLCAIRRLALLLIMTLFHYEGELELASAAPKLQSAGCKWGRTNGLNLVMERLFRLVIFNTCASGNHLLGSIADKQPPFRSRTFSEHPFMKFFILTTHF